MKKYELVFLLSENNNDTVAAEIANEIKKDLTDSGSKIEKEHYWGKKKLAYKIGDNSFAYFYVIVFSAESSEVSKLNKKYTADEKILRHLITNYIEGIEFPIIEEEENVGAEDDDKKDSRSSSKMPSFEEIHRAAPVEKTKPKVTREEDAILSSPDLDIVEDDKEDAEVINEEKVDEPVEEKVLSEEDRKKELDDKLAEILGE